jgi:hypothetical protein
MANLDNGLQQRNRTEGVVRNLYDEITRHGKIHDKGQRVDVIEAALRRCGFTDDNINPNFLRAFYALSDTPNALDSLSAADRVSPLRANSSLKFSSKTAKFASEGDPLLQQTSLITDLIYMVTPDSRAPELEKLFPITNYGAQNLLLDTVDPIQGVTAQKSGLNDQPYRVKPRNITTSIWTGQIWQEYIQFDQQLALFVRQYGNQDISLRGFALIFALAQEQLWHRHTTLVDLQLVYSIINNQITYGGNVIPLGIPNSNIIDWNDLTGYIGTVDPANFTLTPSGDDVFPMLNMIDTIDMHQYRYKRGYKLAWLMNGRTQDLFNQHPNVTNLSQYLNANTLVVNPSSGTVNTFESIMKYLLTGMDQEVWITNASYYPDENDPFGNASSSSFTSGETYPEAVPVMPDGYAICTIIPTEKTGPAFEFAYQPVAQNGGLMNAKGAPAMTIVDTLGSNTFQGAVNPSIYAVLTALGGVRPRRPYDTFVVKIADVA